MNDLADVHVDRLHPFKRTRPIASGQLPELAARGMVVALVAIAIGAATLIPFRFLLCVIAYFVLNVAYSFGLKRMAYVDVACIASGFVLRVLAGGFATGIHVSSFMLACTALLALFLGFGKRRHEMGMTSGGGKQRPSLEAYSPRMLDVAIVITGLASVATYLAYALDPATQSIFGSSLLWLTSIHPLVGVLRFWTLIALRSGSDSPTEEMLRDMPFVLNLVAWTVEVVVLLYGFTPS
jgi:decaprenyl-phosphate phosphoribosyltransferase